MALGGMRRGLLRSWHSEWLKIWGGNLRNGGLCKCWQRYLDADPLELLRKLHYLPWCYLQKPDSLKKLAEAFDFLFEIEICHLNMFSPPCGEPQRPVVLVLCVHRQADGADLAAKFDGGLA